MTDTHPSPRECAAELARALGAHGQGAPVSPGDAAALRRTRPADLSSSAFWRTLVRFAPERLPAKDPARADAEQRWAAIFQAVAICEGLHRSAVPLGAALAEAGLSEVRLTRLLRAEQGVLFNEVERCARYLKAKAAASDVREIADLVLSDTTDWRENVRHKIARSYFHHQRD